jgi:hypothetical protein
MLYKLGARTSKLLQIYAGVNMEDVERSVVTSCTQLGLKLKFSLYEKPPATFILINNNGFSISPR